MEMARQYLAAEYSVSVQKDVITLVALVFTRKTNRRLVKDEIHQSLLQLQRKHFPADSSELRKNSTEYLNYQTLVSGFLDLFAISKELSTLNYLHCVLKEHKNILETEATKTVNTYITQHLCNLTQVPFMQAVDSIMDQVF